MKLPVSATIFTLLLAIPASVGAQSPENVAVVINDLSAASKRIGEYYARQRGIPASNVIHINTSEDETIERGVFAATIQQPIASALTRENLNDRVVYLVLTKGVPLRIAGTGGQDGTTASVDSELTLLYRVMTGALPVTRGRVDNPYFLKSGNVVDAKAFTHRAHDIFLVSRLDAFTVDDVIALIDRARTPATGGRIVLDQRAVPASRVGDGWLATAAERLAAAGQKDRVLLETTANVARDVAPVLGYYSWGSSDPQNRTRNPGMAFAAGAIAATFASSDARTFREPPASWVPSGVALDRATVFAGSAQSLIGDLIRAGVTGVAGQVGEPYLESVVRPDVLFSAYLAGFNLVESFYLALPHLSWQSVVVGDPLCAPFPRKPADAADLNPPIDPQTTLPQFFSARRIQLLASENPGMPTEAVTTWVRSGAMVLRKDAEGAIQALEQTVKLAPAVSGPRVFLGMLYEEKKDYDRASEQYRKILEINPNDVITLNNLAYHLAVRQQQYPEAHALAQRAADLSPMTGTVIDTLGWIEHLMGDDASASRRLADALRKDPANAEIHLHAAIVHAALGARAPAEAALTEALRLNPSLSNTPEVSDLRGKLAKLSPS